jgi:hypothetical protein
MFEKIERLADTLATSAGQSRRDFLGRLGTGAAAVAGLVGGLLLFQGQAIAGKHRQGPAVPGCTGGCRYRCPDGRFVTKGCRSDCTCTQTVTFHQMTCGLYHTTCTPAQ